MPANFYSYSIQKNPTENEQPENFARDVYIKAYNLVCSRPGSFFGKSLDRAGAATWLRQLPSNFDPSKNGMPIIPKEKIFGIVRQNPPALLAVLTNPHMNKTFTQEDLLQLARDSLQAALFILRDADLLNRAGGKEILERNSRSTDMKSTEQDGLLETSAILKLG